MAADWDIQEVEELGVRFGTNLRLTDKERDGLTIDMKAIDVVLLGFQYTLHAEVLMSKELHGKAFIDRFTSLWQGREGVSIRNIGDRRFLARFVGQRDLERVVDADLPWTFKNDLVMVDDRTENGRNLAEAIGGSMGYVRKVDASEMEMEEGRNLTAPKKRMPYHGLDAEVDLRGIPLRMNAWGRGSMAFNGGRFSLRRGRRDRSIDQEGGRRSPRSETVYEMGDRVASGESEVQPGRMDTWGNNLAAYI
ncbi:hypothetical protein ACFXTH_009963 [Malus domestica]